jgi:hypothetical protein
MLPACQTLTELRGAPRVAASMVTRITQSQVPIHVISCQHGAALCAVRSRCAKSSCGKGGTCTCRKTQSVTSRYVVRATRIVWASMVLKAREHKAHWLSTGNLGLQRNPKGVSRVLGYKVFRASEALSRTGSDYCCKIMLKAHAYVWHFSSYLASRMLQLRRRRSARCGEVGTTMTA